jgi:hypothetical protein
MPKEISLRDVENKMFKAVYQDGLVDIAIGGFLLVFVIGPYVTPALGDLWGSVAVFLPLWLIVYPGLWLIRRYVVRPRLGTVKYGAWRISRLKRFNVLALVLLSLSAALGVLSLVEFEAVPGWIHSARFSMIFLLTCSLAAYFLNFYRLLGYGVLIALAPVVGEVLYQYMNVPHHGFPVTFGLSAGIIILIGALNFIRFLREHPLLDNLDDLTGGGE